MSPLLALLALGCSENNLSPKVEAPVPDEATCPPPAPDDALAAVDDTCVVDPPVGAFAPVVEWQWTANANAPGYDDLMSAPSAGNLADDDGSGRIDAGDVPDIVFTSFAGGAYTSAGALTAISGDGSGTHWSLLDAGGVHPWSCGGVAIGDLDGNGANEVCVAGVEAAVLCVDGADGAFRWAAGTETAMFGAPALADLDGDGRSEVIFGRQVFEADGTLRWVGTGGTGGNMSFAADLDVNGALDVVAGNTVYNRDGTIRWTATSPEGVVAPDGRAAVGDFDGDGRGDVVLVASSSLYLVGTNGVVRWTVPLPGGGNGGPPTVADFDNDGAPEIGVAGATTYTVFDTDGSVLWSNPVEDASSNVTGSSVFDFEGDGASDVVYGDELTLRVYDGATGLVKLQLDDHGSGTLYEYPLVLDVDNDGASEIVLASNDYAYAGWHGITVIGDPTWRPSRPIWNQYAYSISNVDDFGGIPLAPAPNWTRWNNFRAGGSLLGTSTELADLEVGPPEVCTARCADEDVVEVIVPVSNTGLADTAPFAVAFGRAGAPIAREELVLASGHTHHVGPYVVDRATWSGGGLRVEADVDGSVEECDEDDNLVDLGPWPCP